MVQIAQIHHGSLKATQALASNARPSDHGHCAANPQPVMPPPAVIPAPIHDGNDRGPIGNACTQAIRAGQVDAIKTLGILPTFIGPDVTLAHGQQDPGFVASMQDALYRAQVGDADQVIFGTGGLALEDQEKLWNWVLTLMGVAQATHFALYAFVRVRASDAQ
jgi:hypothetical protein